MRKSIGICVAALLVFAVLGCSGGEISSKQQSDKADAIHKYVEAHKDPNAERDRGRN